MELAVCVSAHAFVGIMSFCIAMLQMWASVAWDSVYLCCSLRVLLAFGGVGSLCRMVHHSGHRKLGLSGIECQSLPPSVLIRQPTMSLCVKDGEICGTQEIFISRLYKHTETGTAVKARSVTNTLLCSSEKKLVQELILSISNSGPGRSLKPSLFY